MRNSKPIIRYKGDAWTAARGYPLARGELYLPGEPEDSPGRCLVQLQAGSYRYDTIRKADTIVVLVDGRIAEIGTHEELASHTSEFWSLFLAQGSHAGY